MRTVDEYAAEAERLAVEAERSAHRPAEGGRLAQVGQVYATLALAAATRYHQ